MPLPAGSCRILGAQPAEYQEGRSVQAQQTAVGSAQEPSIGRGLVLTKDPLLSPAMNLAQEITGDYWRPVEITGD